MEDLPEISGSVLWLEPDQTSASCFRNHIVRLSEKFQAPVFQPHITLSRIHSLPHHQVLQNLQEISAKQSAFTLQTHSAECREKPYQKIVVPIRTSRKLTDLYNAIDERFGESFSKRTDPHLSLLYSNFQCDTLSDTVGEINPHIPIELYVQKISLIALDGTPEAWSNRFTVFLND